jgi:hypothetical protein
MKVNNLYIVRVGCVTSIEESGLWENGKTHYNCLDTVFICKRKDNIYKDIYTKQKIYGDHEYCYTVGDLFARDVTPMSVLGNIKVKKKDLKELVDKYNKGEEK